MNIIKIIIIFIFSTFLIFSATLNYQEDVVHLGFVGDTMLNAPLNQDNNFLDKKVIHILQKNDINFINLEGTVKEKATPSVHSKCSELESDCFTFFMYPQMLKFFREWHIIGANLANNHSFDFGQLAQDNTVSYLEANQIFPFGTEALPYRILDIKGIRIGILGASPHFHTNNINNWNNIKTEIDYLKANTNFIIAMIHMGAEGNEQTVVTKKTEYYLGENRGNVYEFSHQLVDNGVNLVVGSGPHVLRGIEQYKNAVIAYSLGNFLNYKGFSLSGKLKYGGILMVDIKDAKITNVNFVGTEQNKDERPIVKLSPTSSRFLKSINLTNFNSDMDEFLKYE